MAHLSSISAHRLKTMRQQLYLMAGPCPELFSSLRHHGLDLKAVQAHAGIYAVMLARFRAADGSDGLFDFDINGVPSAIIEALLYDADREQFVADLVAWPLHDPAGFATALGPGAGADVLGAEHMVERGGRPLRVYCTPLEWLQAGCVGCVPLTAIGGRYWLERTGGPFLVGSLAEGRWLGGLLGPEAYRRRILLPESEGRAA